MLFGAMGHDVAIVCMVMCCDGYEGGIWKRQCREGPAIVFRDQVISFFFQVFSHFYSLIYKGNGEIQILSQLCKAMVDRNLFKVVISNEPFSDSFIQDLSNKIGECYGLDPTLVHYYIIHEEVANNAYSLENESIKLLYKDGQIRDITEASDNLNIHTLASPVTKYFLCHPKLHNWSTVKLSDFQLV